jgi:uncharacterized membrane protein
MQARTGRVGLGVVLMALSVTLLLGLLLKTQPVLKGGHLRSPCAEGDWSDFKQYRHLCYSDIVPLYYTEQIQGGRIPFVDTCKPSPGLNCDEYPVVTMFAMYLTAQPVSTAATFFYSNVFLLSIAAVVVAVGLYLLVGTRALWFALAPTLLIYGFMNWDLLAVALATAATVAFLRRRDVAAGILLGLGTAAKLYPVLLIVPFAAQRFRERKPDDAIHLTWAAAGSWLAVNVPFALLGPHDWSEFFRFNSKRLADWDSLWFIACQRLTHNTSCLSPALVNVLSLAAFVGFAVLVWRLRLRHDPEFPRWTFGLPLLILFLLTNKVYSPQYGLWLLPWFALALPRLGRLSPLGLFALFEAADVSVFVTRFSWFGRYAGAGGAPLGAFELAVLIRAVILVACLVAWVRHRAPTLDAESLTVPQEVAA